MSHSDSGSYLVLHFEMTTKLDNMARRDPEIVGGCHHVPMQRNEQLGCNCIPETMIP